MRLLHLDVVKRLILTDSRGKPVPPYSNRSHRRSDLETLIEDILNGHHVGKGQGYRRLRLDLLWKAVQDELLQYFWIDTYCINTWVNKECWKAISSIFQQYWDAA